MNDRQMNDTIERQRNDEHCGGTEAEYRAYEAEQQKKYDEEQKLKEDASGYIALEEGQFEDAFCEANDNEFGDDFSHNGEE
jgi:hypothetical protein